MTSSMYMWNTSHNSRTQANERFVEVYWYKITCLLCLLQLHQQVANAGTSTYSTDEEEEENMKAGSNHSSLLEEEKSEWSVRQASLKQQVADAQAECR